MLNRGGVARYLKYAPDLQALSQPFLVAASQTQISIQANTYIKLINGASHKVYPFANTLTFSLADILDTGVVQQAKDYCLYLVPGGDIVASLNTTWPEGYDEKTRKIGGLHTLCADVGVISGHPLSGYVAGSILPASVWCLNHRPHLGCSPAGMVYSALIKRWTDIYLQSGTGANTASAYGAVITDTRTWLNFVDDLAVVGKRLLDDHEFQVIAAGSNEQTNIAGSADPNTTGGHSDTAGRRMISNIGCEDCAGAMYQWLLTQSTRWDGGSVFSWCANTEGKGSLYIAGDINDVKFLAGGAWAEGLACGSRSRNAYRYRWSAASDFGARGCAE